MIDGPFLAIFQIAVAPEKQGRVFTLVGSLLGLTSPVGLAIAGPVSDWLGLQVWYWVAGVLSTGVGIMFLFNRAVQQIEDKDETQSIKTESPTPRVGDVVVAVD
jgi:DHA3 family macrolide efflux protein-like MFS transporter